MINLLWSAKHYLFYAVKFKSAMLVVLRESSYKTKRPWFTQLNVKLHEFMSYVYFTKNQGLVL